MKPKDLKIPFVWEDRRPLLENGVLFVPHYYTKHKEGILNLQLVNTGSCASKLSLPCEENHFLSLPEFFGREAPTYVEYCSGHGHWVTEKAKQFPESNWIAVEKRFDRVRKIWSKGQNEGLKNLLIVYGDAWTFTELYLPDNCLCGSFINFPDPWPKEKHAKHRLFQDNFIEQMARVTSPGGKSIVATDDPLWASRINETIQNSASWRSSFPDPFFITEWPDYGTSYFDQLWRDRGRTIHYLQFINHKK